MNTVTTTDHDDIQDWIEDRGGEPARERGNPEHLGIDFGESDDLAKISWPEFFEIFESQGLKFIHEQDNPAVDDGRSSREKYDFEIRTREEEKGIPETEMDDEDVMGNMEETFG